MDFGCPVCAANLGKRRLSEAVIARMEIECANCKSRLRLNVHRAELFVVLLNFGTIVTLGLLAYGFQSQDLLVAAVIAAMAGALAFPLLEHTYLRNWPRYVYP